MDNIDYTSAKFIVKIVIPVLILSGAWIYSFIKGLMKKDVRSNGFEQAIKYYSKKIKAEPYNYINYFERGTANLKLGSYACALDDFNKTIELNSEYSDAYVNRAIAYYTLGDSKNALNDCNMSIKLNPASAIPYYNRSIILYNLGEFDSAVADCKAALELNPRDQDALSFYGRLQYELENKS